MIILMFDSEYEQEPILFDCEPKQLTQELLESVLLKECAGDFVGAVKCWTPEEWVDNLKELEDETFVAFDGFALITKTPYKVKTITQTVLVQE